MNIKAKKTKKQVNPENFTRNFLSDDEISKKIQVVEKELKASTWRELETKGKFVKNDKISFISEEMLIVGCDIGSETHYIRAIDLRGRELSKGAFEFSNSEGGFESAKAWMLNLVVTNGKNQIVLGLEPTGHYWFALAAWMVSKGISVVQVNPYAVKQSKEIEDNSQHKDDRKDPKIIANLVKDGNYGMPYLPTEIYADMRRLSMFRDQLVKDRIRNINRLHREMKIYFPEYMDAFGKIDGAFTLEVLQVAPIPTDIIELGADGLRNIWRAAKLRGRGYSRADKIINYAHISIGLRDGENAGRESVKWFAMQIVKLDEQLAEIEETLHSRCMEIPHAENVLEIKGIGENILAGILSEMGDITRFDDAKEIQKLSGLGLVACSSGKHKGQTKISHRGRKRLRYWLFQAAKSAVSHADEYKQLHVYYTTRAENPLKKMQSLIVIACKILRVIYTILKTGRKYDPKRLLQDIKRPDHLQKQSAA
jgi:transposase